LTATAGVAVKMNGTRVLIFFFGQPDPLAAKRSSNNTKRRINGRTIARGIPGVSYHGAN